MSSVGGYSSHRYETLEDLAERLDWTAKNSPEFEQVLRDYLGVLHGSVQIRSAMDDYQPLVERRHNNKLRNAA
ncbi:MULTISPECIES: hypothetical protein [Nocardia]|uniref:hypothetical protein n=1 Tax=Nocardia TaxID=1817 RepID=UPI001300706B|nr:MULTISPECIES: hypothetical protein [Nocardia]